MAYTVHEWIPITDSELNASRKFQSDLLKNQNQNIWLCDVQSSAWSPTIAVTAVMKNEVKERKNKSQGRYQLESNRFTSNITI